MVQAANPSAQSVPSESVFITLPTVAERTSSVKAASNGAGETVAGYTSMHASTGNGNPTHLSMELFKSMAGIRMNHVPYKGSAAALPELIAGQVQVMVDFPITAMPHVRSGRLRALASTTAQRPPTLPDIPTVAESGYPGYNTSSWFGMTTRKGTPPAIISRLDAALAEALAGRELREKFSLQSMEIAHSSAAALNATVERERIVWGKVIQQVGVRLD